MARPDNSLPPRPAAVPADARWEPSKTPGFEWKQGGRDAEGRRHGLYRSWTRDGCLHAETPYDHGAIHGVNRTFHPDGTLASEATWVRGVIMDSACFRSDHPTTEPFAQAAPSVWAVRYCTRDGRTNHAIRYFARDGRECGPDGRPMPPRPRSVGEDARWFPELERWIDGAIERGTNAQVGRWRWWSKDGVLRREELRDPRGEPTVISEFRADGSLQTRTMRDPGTTRTSWYRGGTLVLETRREGDVLVCRLYHADGAVVAGGRVAAGRLAGTWCFFDDDGEVRREADLTALGLEHDPSGEELAHRLGEALFRLDDATGEPPVAGRPRSSAPPLAVLARAAGAHEPLTRAWALAALDEAIAGAPRADAVELARSGPDASVRAVAGRALVTRADAEPAEIRAVLADRDLLVRSAAAIELARTRGPDAPREAVTALADTLRGGRELIARYAALPRAGDHVLAEVALALGAIGSPDARSLAKALCTAFTDLDDAAAPAYGGGLLLLAFGRGERPFAKRFLDLLEAVVQSDGFWASEASARALLATYRLPVTRRELAALVAGLREAGDPESRMHEIMHAGDQGRET